MKQKNSMQNGWVDGSKEENETRLLELHTVVCCLRRLTY